MGGDDHLASAARLLERSDCRSILICPSTCPSPYQVISTLAAQHGADVVQMYVGCKDTEETLSKMVGTLKGCLTAGDWLLLVQEGNAVPAECFRRVARIIGCLTPNRDAPYQEHFRLWVQLRQPVDAADSAYPALFQQLALQDTTESCPSDDLRLGTRFYHPSDRDYAAPCPRKLAADRKVTAASQVEPVPSEGAAVHSKVAAAEGVEMIEGDLPGSENGPPDFTAECNAAVQSLNEALITLFFRDSEAARAHLRHVYHMVDGIQTLVKSPAEEHMLIDQTIPCDQLEMIEVLWEGTTCTYWRGRFCATDVVIKEARIDAQIQDWLSHVRAHQSMKHPSIVLNMGIGLGKCAVLHVVEFGLHGPLGSALRRCCEKREPINFETFFAIATQVALALNYLHMNNFVHRDVGSRSVIKFTASLFKLSITPMVRLMGSQGACMESTMPLRWTSPESLATSRFTSASDIWSFGVLMWEILTYATLPPLPEIDRPAVKQYLSIGGRPEIPAGCPRELWDVVVRPCFLPADQRPSAADLLPVLQAKGSVSHKGIKVRLSYSISSPIPFPQKPKD